MIRLITESEARQQIIKRSKKIATVNKIEKALGKLTNGKALLVSNAETRRLGYRSTTYSPMGAVEPKFRKLFTAKKHPRGWVILKK